MDLGLLLLRRLRLPWSSFVEEVEVAEVKNARVSLTGEKRQKEEICDRLAACLFSYL